MNVEKLKTAILNYNANIREIARIHAVLQSVEFKGVASMSGDIKSSEVSNPIVGEIIRREAKHKRLDRLEKEVLFIQQQAQQLDDEELQRVLDYLLDGMTPSEISRELDVTRQTVYRKIDKLVKIMLEVN